MQMAHQKQVEQKNDHEAAVCCETPGQYRILTIILSIFLASFAPSR